MTDSSDFWSSDIAVICGWVSSAGVGKPGTMGVSGAKMGERGDS